MGVGMSGIKWIQAIDGTMVVTFAGVHRSWRGDINIGVGKQPDGILYYTHEMTVTVADSIAGVTFATSLTEWRNVVGGISVSHIQPNANMIPIVTLKVKYLIRPNLLCLMWQRVPRCQMQLLIWGITGNLHANRTPDANTEMWGTTTTIFTWLGDEAVDTTTGFNRGIRHGTDTRLWQRTLPKQD